MLAQNIVMTVVNIIVLIALFTFGIVAVYRNKPNFELTPQHLYDQQMGQKYGVWVFVFVIISWLVTLPGMFGPLSEAWYQILWWVELVTDILAIIFCCIAIFYYNRLNTRPHD
ncbi:MAG: hypothetical protein UHD09_05675 [Bifidobacterium sp.]|nr:hypothetical protein [Bifidobacterium sp.]